MIILQGSWVEYGHCGVIGFIHDHCMVGNVIQGKIAMVGLHNPVEIVASEGIMCTQLFSLFRFSEGHILR